MKGDYGNYRKRTPEKKSRRRGLNLLDYIALIGTVVCGGLLLASYLARHVNPNDFWPFALLGLAAPVFYLLNIVLLLYWVLRWRIWALVPAVVLLMGLGGLTSLIRPVLSRHYSEGTDAPSVNIVSYNVMGFLDQKDPLHVTNMSQIVSFVDSLSPDLLCIQEYQSTPKAPKTRIDSMLAALPHNVVNYKISSKPGYGWGVAIYSRYPIVRSGHVDFENSSNSALWADIAVNKRDTIRVFNNHLQTTSINSSDRDFITSQQIVRADGEQKKERLKKIVHKLRENYKIRARQVDSLSPLIRESPYPVIVCGDFNDTPMSYAYHTVRGDLSDAFIEKGRGMTNTYRGFFNMFRIDYVFHSPVLEAVSYNTPASEWSDHNPVVVRLKLPEAAK